MEKLTVAGEGSVQGLKDGEEIVVQIGDGSRFLCLLVSLCMVGGGIFVVFNAIEHGRRLYMSSCFAGLVFVVALWLFLGLLPGVSKWVVDARGVRCGRGENFRGLEWGNVRAVRPGFMGEGLVLQGDGVEVPIPDLGASYPRVIQSVFGCIDPFGVDAPKDMTFVKRWLVVVAVVCALFFFCLYMDFSSAKGDSVLAAFFVVSIVVSIVLVDVVRNPFFVSMTGSEVELRRLFRHRRIRFSDIHGVKIELAQKPKGGWDFVLALDFEDETLRLHDMPKATLCLYYKIVQRIGVGFQR